MNLKTIFYAWQSDLPEELNREFIREAAQEAISQLAADASIEEAERLALDHDTQNVAGMPDIVQTVLQKIDLCSCFVADLSFVGTTPATGRQTTQKRLPNPNVLLELGWAMKSVGPERVISVMNTAFGQPDQLPFDLRTRRHPIQYQLPSWDAPDRENIKRKLVSDLSDAVQATLSTAPTIGTRAEQAARAQAETEARIERARSEFYALVQRHQFHGVKPARGILALSLIPEQPLNPLLSFADPRSRQIRLRSIDGREVPPGFFGSCCAMLCHHQSQDPPYGAVELRRDGVIYAADGYLLAGGNVPESVGRGNGDQVVGCVPSVAYERMLIEAVFKGVQLQRTIGVRGRIHCSMAMFSIDGFIMGVNSFAFVLGTELRIYRGDGIVPDTVTIDERADVSSPEAVARLLRPALDYVWVELGYDRSQNFDTEGNWKQVKSVFG